MAVEFHREARVKLVRSITEALGEIRVRHGIFLDRRSLHVLSKAATALPSHGALRETLIRYVDDDPLPEFVSGYLSRALSAGTYRQNEVAPLEGVAGFEDLGKVAEEIVSSLERLPYRYSFTVALPDEIGRLLPENTKLDLSPEIRLVSSGTSLERELPLTTGDREADERIFHHGLIFGGPEKWSGVYLQVIQEGYVGTYTDTAAQRAAVDVIRSFLGLSFALRTWDRRYTWSAATHRRRVRVHRLDSDGWKLDETFELDAGLSELISDLTFDDLGGTVTDDEERIALLKRFIRQCTKAFSGPAGRRILLAGRWVLNSLVTDDELLAFVQGMVVLEILLGDKAASDKIGLGELLRNRCAYLIGRSAEERDSILKEFGTIYDVRSQIVHRGKSRLTPHERRLFDRLRWFGNRAIQEEIKLLPDAPQSDAGR